MIGTGGGEVPPSLLLYTDSQRYLFNCGENLQRLCLEHKIRLSRLQSFFITRLSWNNLGGLAGLAMGLREIGNESIHLYGPRALERFRKASRCFLARELIKLETPESSVCSTSPLPVYSDENVTITTVELLSGRGEGNLTETDSDSSEEEVRLEEARESRAKKPKLASPLQQPGTIAAFICKLVDVRGKFNSQRATELGLKMGLLCKKLLEGESVTLPDGRIIHPSDVVGPKQRGPTFMVLECPHPGFIHSVTTHPQLRCDAFTGTDQSLMLVVHMAPEEVLQNEEYCRWMASFGENTKHLVLNGTQCLREVAMRASTKIQCHLHHMNPSIHHLPVIPEVEVADKDLTLFHFVPRESVVFGKTLMNYHLKPVSSAGVDLSSTLRPMEEDIAERMLETRLTSTQDFDNDPEHTAAGSTREGPIDPLEEETRVDVQVSETAIDDAAPPSNITTLPSLPTSVGQPPTLHVLTPDDALVTFLGTGASNPSKYRNVSGILIQTPVSGNLLLDCGEGTLSQLYRCFGERRGDNIIRNLGTVFVSHIHGDHHIGLISILQRRVSLLRAAGGKRKRTVVICPYMVGNWLTQYGRMCERIGCRLVDSQNLTDRPAPVSRLQTDLSFQTVPVIHCKEAYGVVVQHRSGWKVVYSGDTRPCPALAEAGRGATLLLHEATFEDSMQSDAVAKKHCTISEALGIAREMKPGFTILTHFSQRYPKVSPAMLKDEYLKSKVAMAFDCMSVTLKELHTLPSYVPAMKEIFAAVLDKEDDGNRISWSW